MLRGFCPVHHKADFGLLVFHVPIDVHNTRSLFHDSADFAGEREALRFVGTVNFRDDRLQHRWARRHLGHRDGSAVFFGNGGHEGTHPFRDRVTLVGARLLTHKVHLDVRDIRPAAKVGVADEAVEIKRCGGASVDLKIAHFRECANRLRHLAGNAGGLFERRALGRVQHHLELRLVVEGQHLDRDGAGEDERHRAEE